MPGSIALRSQGVDPGEPRPRASLDWAGAPRRGRSETTTGRRCYATYTDNAALPLPWRHGPSRIARRRRRGGWSARLSDGSRCLIRDGLAMSRPGGPADKLGNRYEGVWTVDAILDVVERETRAVFGSGTSASILEELTDRARSAASADDFDGWLRSSGRLSAVFEDDIVSISRGDRLAELRCRTRRRVRASCSRSGRRATSARRRCRRVPRKRGGRSPSRCPSSRASLARRSTTTSPGRKTWSRFFLNNKMGLVENAVADAAGGEGSVVERVETALRAVLRAFADHPVLCTELPVAARRAGGRDEGRPGGADSPASTADRRQGYRRAPGARAEHGGVRPGRRLMQASFMQVADGGGVDADGLAEELIPILVQGLGIEAAA